MLYHSSHCRCLDFEMLGSISFHYSHRTNKKRKNDGIQIMQMSSGVFMDGIAVCKFVSKCTLSRFKIQSSLERILFHYQLGIAFLPYFMRMTDSKFTFERYILARSKIIRKYLAIKIILFTQSKFAQEKKNNFHFELDFKALFNVEKKCKFGKFFGLKTTSQFSNT